MKEDRVREILNNLFSPWKMNEGESVHDFFYRVDADGQFDMHHVLKILIWLFMQIEMNQLDVEKQAKLKKK